MNNAASLSFACVFMAASAVAVGTASNATEPSITQSSIEKNTRWVVRPSVGLDALTFLGALSGDKLQGEIYRDQIALFRDRMGQDAQNALTAIGLVAREEDFLVGPYLALVFSVNDAATLDDVLASARDPEGRLRPNFETTPYWEEDQWPAAREMIATHVEPALRALRQAGFKTYWQEEVEPSVIAATSRYETALSGYDVIGEQERLLGRDLDSEIELIILNFSKPYGIRITGQRFLSHHSYDPTIQLRTAAHEIFHPAFDRQDEGLLLSLTSLQEDPWMISIIEDHDPRFGYNSFLGVLDEDSAEALDQIVSERLGFARDPARRWRHHDGGMHMLAAALYRAMKDDGFHETGGRYEDWLRDAIARGLLEPESAKRLAREVVGDDAVDAWGPHRSNSREEP